MKPWMLLFILFLAPAWAQDVKFPADFEKLAAKASEVVDVTLDGALLQLASRFLSNKDPEEARVKQLVSKLKGIYVKSFEFDKEGAYSKADLEAIRGQLKAPTWSRMVTVRSTKSSEDADVYFKMENGQPTGLVVLAAEPRELTVVNIVGPIDIDQLTELSGHFGVPKVQHARPKPAGKD